MALADPQVITIDATPYSCAKVDSAGTRSVYATSDEKVKLTFSHSTTKAGRKRRMVRVDNRVVAANPLTSVNEHKDLAIYLVIDQPEYGFTDEEIDDVGQAFFTLLNSTLMAKVLGGQH